MKYARALAFAAILAAAHAYAATDGQDCRAFATHDLATTLYEEHDAPTRLGNGQQGVFGDFAPVVASCAAALTESPGDPALQIQQVRALIAQNDFKAALPVLQSLAQAKNPAALRIYGILLSYGFGPPNDQPSAQSLLAAAADRGDPVASLFIAMSLLRSGEPESAYHAGFVLAADAGYAPAEYYAWAEVSGGKLTGIPPATSRRWLENAAQSWPPAMSSLARLLRQGSKLSSDHTRADDLEYRVQAIRPDNSSRPIIYYWQFG